jgi:hypothetical protein
MVNIKAVRTTPQRDYRSPDPTRDNAVTDIILSQKEADAALDYIASVTDRGLARHSMNMHVLSRVVPA